MNSKTRKKIIVFGAVFGLLLFLHYTGLLAPVEGAAQWALRPLLRTAQKSGSAVSGLFTGRQDQAQLAAELMELKAENQALLEASAKLGLLEEENQALRDHLLFQRKSESRFLMANVIARGEIGTGQQRVELLTIDLGSRQGLVPGLGAVAGNGTLVGKVARVSENISEIELTNNPACRLAAKIMNTDRTNGIVQGDLGLTLRMDFIPQSVEILPEALIVTSGLEEKIPAGLVIGRVAKVHKENNELWQQAVIEPIIDPEDLVVLSIVMP